MKKYEVRFFPNGRAYFLDYDILDEALKAGKVNVKVTAENGVYTFFEIQVISSGNEGYCSANPGGNTGGPPQVRRPQKDAHRADNRGYRAGRHNTAGGDDGNPYPLRLRKAHQHGYL